MVSAIANAGAGGRIQNAIATAAAGSGVDFQYLMHQARVESGFDTNARARTSSATGLYQFIEQSWLGAVKKHGEENGLGWAANAIQRGAGGRLTVSDPTMRQAILDLRRNPEVSSTMAAEYAADNRDYLQGRLGHEVESVDLYLAHFLGPAGAGKFLSAYDADPNQSAASLFPAAARANRAVFYSRDGSARSLDQVRDRFAAKFGGETNVDVPARAWNPMQVASYDNTNNLNADTGSGSARTPVQNARLAYLMLASLGV